MTVIVELMSDLQILFFTGQQCPLWERARERGQAGLGEKKFRSLEEVFLYSSLFNPQAPLPEIRDFDPPTRGGLSLIT